MLVFRIALRNLSRRGRKTFVISALIAVGIAAFFTGNAVLESSIGGIQRTFAGNFTADLSLSAKSDQSFSLFGPDIPVIGDSESVPLIVNARVVGEAAEKTPGVQAIAYVLSAPLLLEAGTARDAGLALGAIGEEYFRLFTAPRFLSGAAPSAGSSGWAVLSEGWASDIARQRGSPLALGEKLQLTLNHNQTFTIRAATLVGIIRYQPGNEALRHVVIIDGRILRALGGYSQTDGQVGRAVGTPAVNNLDSLFSSGTSAEAGSTAEPTSPISMQELKDLLNEAHRAGAAAAETPLDHDGAWHFILLKIQPGASTARIAADLRRGLSVSGMPVIVRDWRGTAGGVATYVFLMQIVLYVGIFMLGGIVIILTMNSIVMSVFERTSEIGTMRAIGASRPFVQRLFIVESCSLTLASGVPGVLIGLGVVAILDVVQLHFTNQILVLLFGGASLHPPVSGWNIALSIAASLAIGMVAWTYPVHIALRIQPVRAIHAS